MPVINFAFSGLWGGSECKLEGTVTLGPTTPIPLPSTSVELFVSPAVFVVTHKIGF
jgi:hypothetical protein